jgi:hypothetical protein
MPTLSDAQRDALGQTAYAAYARSTGGKTYDGRDMPTWDSLTDAIREAWRSAASAAATTYATEMVS